MSLKTPERYNLESLTDLAEGYSNGWKSFSANGNATELFKTLADYDGVTVEGLDSDTTVRASSGETTYKVVGDIEGENPQVWVSPSEKYDPEDPLVEGTAVVLSDTGEEVTSNDVASFLNGEGRP